MNDRLVSLLGAGVALLAVIGLLAPTPGSQPVESWPLSTDRGAQGFDALRRWLARSTIEVVSLRQRYDELSTLAPGTGHLLVSVLPHRTVARAGEAEHLVRWVAAGNSALLLVAGATVPAWARANAEGDMTVLPRALGLDLGQARAPAVAGGGAVPKLLTAREASPATSFPRAQHPLLAGVKTIAGDPPEPRAGHVTLVPRHAMRVVPALLRSDGPQAADLWFARAGGGRVLVLADPATFGNARLGDADNARLFDNIIGFVRGPDGKVIFDDMHQGLTDLYDPRAFARDPRLHASLAFLVGAWLIWVIGHSNRFGPLLTHARSESRADYARAVGGLLARQATATDAAAALLAHFERDCRRRHPQYFAERPLAAVLTSLPGMPASAVAGVKAAQAALAAEREPDLIALTNHLRALRARL